MNATMVVSEPLVWAIVYVVTLVCIDSDDVMNGTPYVGQTVGCGNTAKEVVKRRWCSEQSLAARKSKKYGFIAALQIYSPIEFQWCIFATKFGPRDDVQDWANRIERDEIHKRGGVLKDMFPSSPLLQTFNIQRGGKGNRKFWCAIEAKCTRCWKQFKDALTDYVAMYNTALVPYIFVDARNYKLGMRLSDVRCNGVYLDGRVDGEERRQWLYSLPEWTDNVKTTPEYWKRVANTRKENWKKRPIEEKEEIRKKLKTTLALPDVKKGYVDRATERMNRPESKEKCSKQFTAMWANDTVEEHKARVQKLKDGNAKPSAKLNRSVAMKKVNSMPGFVEKRTNKTLETKKKKSRARLVLARKEALPYEPNYKLRVGGAFYFCKDRISVGRAITSKSRQIFAIGPIIDP